MPTVGLVFKDQAVFCPVHSPDAQISKCIGGTFTMNKAELVESVAAKSGLTKKDSEKAVAAVVDTIVATLAKGEKVQLVGFGTFETRVHKERTNIKPQTKKEQVIPQTTVPAFKPGKAFKDAVK